jgi:uncharacterized protein YdhG (YjbR/CyaY superfamily)
MVASTPYRVAMTTPGDGDRTRHWPAIEARYGRPIADWLELMAERVGERYPEQVAFLREEHGFSQAHANAVVMYARGSKSSRRFTTLDDYLAAAEPVGAATVRRIFQGLVTRHPGSSIEIAWNQPFLTIGGQRLFSVGVLTRHLLAAPGSVEVLDAFRDRLERDHGLVVNRKTFRLPLDWEIDEELLDGMVAAERAHVAAE